MIEGTKRPFSVYKDAPPGGPHELIERVRDPVAKFLTSALVQQVRNEPAPLSEFGACTLLVEFANEGHLSASQWAEFMGPRSDTGTTLSGQLNLVRSQLGELIKYRALASRKLGSWWADEMQRHGLVAIPLAMFEDGALWMGHQVLARNISAACAYAMCLLLDTTRPFGASLYRCRIESCGRFFFEEKAAGRGKPRREYCSDDCALVGHRIQIKESVRRHRAKKASRSKRK